MSRAILFRGTIERLFTNRHWWVTLTLIALVTIFYYGFCDSRNSFIGFFFFELKNDVIGILYLIPFAYATLRLGLVGATASWAVSLVIVMPRFLRYYLGIDSFINNVAHLSIPLLIVAIVLLELQWRERHHQMMLDRERERRLHIDRVFSVQEEERQRISQGLHDDVLQRLLSIAYMAERMGSNPAASSHEVTSQALMIRDESVQLSDELRRLSYDLRPSILDNLGLVPAVNWLCNRLRKEAMVSVKMFVQGKPRRLGAAVETTAFRIAQEALNNVGRHAHASEVNVILSFASDHVVLEVSDNGVGFASGSTMKKAALDGHLGLLGIRERVASLNGTVTIRTRPSEGTRVRTRLPVDVTTNAVDA